MNSFVELPFRSILSIFLPTRHRINCPYLRYPCKYQGVDATLSRGDVAPYFRLPCLSMNRFHVRRIHFAPGDTGFILCYLFNGLFLPWKTRNVMFDQRDCVCFMLLCDCFVTCFICSVEFVYFIYLMLFVRYLEAAVYAFNIKNFVHTFVFISLLFGSL